MLTCGSRFPRLIQSMTQGLRPMLWPWPWLHSFCGFTDCHESCLGSHTSAKHRNSKRYGSRCCASASGSV